MKYHLKILEDDFNSIKEHLFPGDGLEAVSVLICGRANKGKSFLVHKVIHIPYDQCERSHNLINWSTSLIAEQLPSYSKKKLAIFKIHSHPGGHNKFSEIDNRSDIDFFDSIYGWYDDENLHGSLIMLPDNTIIGRVITPELKFEAIDKISIIGRNLTILEKNDSGFDKELNLRNFQTLGEGTQNLLKNLTVGVVGCSGTGSPVIEQLSRLGVGRLILIDPDKIELKNLNRIINSKKSDAELGKLKVDVLKTSISKIGFSTEVITYATNLYDNVEAVNELSTCDFIFGCVDSIDGRHLINTISSFYLIPYIDVGIKILSDKQGGIDQICGTIHYLTPKKSSLQTRGVYTHEMLRAANMLRNDPKEYEKQQKTGYIVDVDVEAPAVISINMYASSLAVNEFLSRIHEIKVDDLSGFDIIRFSLTDYYLMNETSNDEVDIFLMKNAGRGDMSPFLNMPEFS